MELFTTAKKKNVSVKILLNSIMTQKKKNVNLLPKENALLAPIMKMENVTLVLKILVMFVKDLLHQTAKNALMDTFSLKKLNSVKLVEVDVKNVFQLNGVIFVNLEIINT